MEGEAKKEASIEAAVNAVKKKHKFGYKDVSRANRYEALNPPAD